jgi:predicted ester cyclase
VDAADHRGRKESRINPLSERNKSLARLYLERFPHDQNLPDEAFATGFLFHHIRDIEGADAFKEFMAGVSRAFPDFSFDIHHVVAEGDFVAAHYDLHSGTQADVFLDAAPSQGRSFSTRGMSLFRCVDGKIQEIWVTFFTLAAMQQLGAVPELGRP